MNLNDNVKVKLTEDGMKIFHEYYDQTLVRKVDENGYTEFQLWELMSIYGSRMHLSTYSLPFETEILVV